MYLNTGTTKLTCTVCIKLNAGTESDCLQLGTVLVLVLVLDMHACRTLTVPPRRALKRVTDRSVGSVLLNAKRGQVARLVTRNGAEVTVEVQSGSNVRYS